MVEFIKELQNLLKKHNVRIGVDIDGDTHGIKTNVIVGSLNDRTQFNLNEGSSYIDSSDLDIHLNDLGDDDDR